MFEDSELINQTSLNVVTVEQLEVTPSTSSKPPNWENWTQASLRQPVSDELVTGKRKPMSGGVNMNKRQRKLHNDVDSKKKDVYDKQLQLIEVEKERGCIRFEWEKLEHELKVEALRLDIEIKKKNSFKFKLSYKFLILCIFFNRHLYHNLYIFHILKKYFYL
ncbi:uncharacterized protein LOC111033563 [Myzus persicae]|uniref:uncharacterized protein LOC111033563 n=1 Tax=Myzus persicae TaxID=13164 RepID=UPI000B939A47|nr:uncharacterized protein LOC111033563 [Myzus persicae]